ncbi:hypothetical protein [Streptomyces lichenis]|uniref:Uncharacterized protein n=1 Tax=Streptomyces lichenis TaxID=2306967 RepID=A0ABT0I9U1_9ACTN|nr:hypothetical protein [Streptomyces lichenis]MCK8678090.1 hypothetical protein [Streptomyces lichenis]
MTSDALSAVHAPPRGLPLALRTVAIATCLPYLVLKVVWIAGGRVGIPDGSVLLEHRTLLLVANTVLRLAFSEAGGGVRGSRPFLDEWVSPSAPRTSPCCTVHGPRSPRWPR